MPHPFRTKERAPISTLLSEEEATDETAERYAEIRKTTGMVPNLFLGSDSPQAAKKNNAALIVAKPKRKQSMDVKQSIRMTLKGVAIASLASGVGLATSGCASMQGSCGKGSCGDSHQEGMSSCGKGSCGGEAKDEAKSSCGKGSCS